MLKSKYSTIIIHITGWLLFLLLPLLFLNSGNKTNTAWILLSSPFYWLFGLTYLTLFYFNIWFLIPRFFLKKKYIIYNLAVLVLLSMVYFLQPFDKLLAHNPRVEAQMFSSPDSLRAIRKKPDTDTGFHPFGPLPHQDLRMHEPPIKQAKYNPLWHHSKNTDVVSLVLFFMITALALSMRTVEQWHFTEQKVIKAESEKVNAELSFLKAQINPHFLFNTLNNIYTLSVMNSQHTSESIMKLSNIMRYVTDEVSNDFVPLSNELDCIKDYIDLQKLRLGSKTPVKLTIAGQIGNKHVPPLILMSFIENTFKYGVSKKERSTIDIAVRADDRSVIFTCENKIFNRQITERTGIGIANTRQRLEYLYPRKHKLTIREEEGTFHVELILNN